MFGENWRGLHAQQLLTGSKDWTLDKLQAAAFDERPDGFANLVRNHRLELDRAGPERRAGQGQALDHELVGALVELQPGDGGVEVAMLRPQRHQSLGEPALLSRIEGMHG